jgi:hypothetical protein
MIDSWWLFPLGFAFDFLYIAWYWAAEREYALLGGIASVLTVAVGFAGISESLENHWNLIPYFGGLFLGSAWGIKVKAWWNRRTAVNPYEDSGHGAPPA